MNKKFVFLFSLILNLSFSAYSQSADKMSEILETQTVTYGQVSYLACVFSNTIDEDVTYDKALATMKSNSLVPMSVKTNDPIKLGKVAQIFARAANLKGGLMYTITKSQRYSFKELKAQDILPQNADPSMKISGREALAILQECIDANSK